jgi:FkbH-like protein
MSGAVASEDELLATSRALATASPDPVALQKLGRRIARAVSSGRFADRRIKVAVLSSFLVDMLVDAFSACLLARGIAADIVTAPYGVIAVDLLSEQSITRGCDIVLILPTYRDLVHRPMPGCSLEAADQAAAREADNWQALWRHVGDAAVVQLSFGPPPDRPLADADGLRPGGFLRFIRDVNRRLADASPNRVALVDAEALAVRIGPDWNDPGTYFLCKQPFGIAALAEVANTLAAATCGVLGKARKVLVLDLDNTLWGGVVGDVGVQGITVGTENAEGEAFVAIQRLAHDLAARGVILAVCSKNDEENAREPFRKHSGMILREDDFACFIANFEDKATNLRRIAQTLNVGLDALVFVDDNPVERAWVLRELPEVAVVNLPDDPALYCAAIERAQLFPLNRVTEEDLGRNRSYKARAVVARAQASSANVTEFLESLEPVVTLEPVNATSLERIVQLIAKTNQFKLNPQTFTPEALVGLGAGVFAIRFRDRLQDYGIVAVVVTNVEEDELIILNWVMSCRVFCRRLEHATLELLQAHARAHGLLRLRANYKTSPKNGVTRSTLTELGFEPDLAGDFTMFVSRETATSPHFMRIEKPQPNRGEQS